MPLDLTRVADIKAKGEQSDRWDVGSGYLLTPDVVLTAGHVVETLSEPFGDKESCYARSLTSKDYTPVTRVIRDVTLDVAVLRTVEPLSSTALPTLPWGR